MLKAKVAMTFTEPMLGSSPMNKDMYADYIESRRPKRVDAVDGVEVDTLPEVDEDRGWTGFHSDERGIFVYDYTIKGMFKEIGNILKENFKEKAVKKKFDNYLFIFPRRVYLCRDGVALLKPDGVLERPLRAETAQGPRVTLARSDTVNPGTSIDYTLEVIDGCPLRHPEEMIQQILEYGKKYKGFGQWRGGSYGRFDYKLEFDILKPAKEPKEEKS